MGIFMEAEMPDGEIINLRTWEDAGVTPPQLQRESAGLASSPGQVSDAEDLEGPGVPRQRPQASGILGSTALPPYFLDRGK